MQREVEENYMAQQPPWLLKIALCYDREGHTNNNKKNQHFLKHKEKHKNTTETYTVS